YRRSGTIRNLRGRRQRMPAAYETGLLGFVENDSHFQGRRQEMQQLIPRIYNGLSGMAIERHICATGLPSLPGPSFGFLKWRPMMSTNGSILTTTPGSNA